MCRGEQRVGAGRRGGCGTSGSPADDGVAGGTPQPVPVWFLWDGDASILLYSRPDQPKLRNIGRNPRVSLHLDGNGQGGDVVVCLGEAFVSDDPPSDRVPGASWRSRRLHRA